MWRFRVDLGKLSLTALKHWAWHPVQRLLNRLWWWEAQSKQPPNSLFVHKPSIWSLLSLSRKITVWPWAPHLISLGLVCLPAVLHVTHHAAQWRGCSSPCGTRRLRVHRGIHAASTASTKPSSDNSAAFAHHFFQNHAGTSVPAVTAEHSPEATAAAPRPQGAGQLPHSSARRGFTCSHDAAAHFQQTHHDHKC